MELKKVDAERARDLYDHYLVEDFPEDEIKPFFIIERAMKEGHYEVIEAFDEDGLAGYAFTVLLDRNDALLDYLAVTKERRGQGLGTLFLQKLVTSSYAGMTLYLEVESPSVVKDEEEKNLRQRRIDFYLRNGAKKTMVQVFFFGVLYEILVFSPLKDAPWKRMVRHMYRQIVAHHCVVDKVTPIISSMTDKK